LRAFNVETALVADSVREGALAQIRMQWWRDAADSVFGPKPQPHPVIQALREVGLIVLYLQSAVQAVLFHTD